MMRCIDILRPSTARFARAQGEDEWLMALRKSPRPEREAERSEVEQSKDAGWSSSDQP
jgi:hypothetical protein